MGNRRATIRYTSTAFHNGSAGVKKARYSAQDIEVYVSSVLREMLQSRLIPEAYQQLNSKFGAPLFPDESIKAPGANAGARICAEKWTPRKPHLLALALTPLKDQKMLSGGEPVVLTVGQMHKFSGTQVRRWFTEDGNVGMRLEIARSPEIPIGSLGFEAQWKTVTSNWKLEEEEVLKFWK